MQNKPITSEGFLMLKKKLSVLTNIDRHRIINAIKKAREHGDLKENAEYHAAKEEQFFLEKKIKELEIKIASSRIVDLKKIKDKSKIFFGATVCLKNLLDNRIVSYRIVGDDEADINNNRIAVSAPLSRSMLSKSCNEIIEVKTISGFIRYKIERIDYF